MCRVCIKINSIELEACSKLLYIGWTNHAGESISVILDICIWLECIYKLNHVWSGHIQESATMLFFPPSYTLAINLAIVA